MPARIFPPAEARLIEIWNYTLETWGEKQADTYVADLIKAIHTLHSRRVSWKPVPDPALRGVWFVRHEHHFVFFRELSGGAIGVITILHKNTDIPARLREDDHLPDGP